MSGSANACIATPRPAFSATSRSTPTAWWSATATTSGRRWEPSGWRLATRPDDFLGGGLRVSWGESLDSQAPARNSLSLTVLALRERIGGEDLDGLGHPLQGHGADPREGELLVGNGIDDGFGHEHLARAGVVGEPGGDVHRAAEVVALLEHHRPGVDADTSRRQRVFLGA